MRSSKEKYIIIWKDRPWAHYLDLKLMFPTRRVQAFVSVEILVTVLNIELEILKGSRTKKNSFGSLCRQDDRRR